MKKSDNPKDSSRRKFIKEVSVGLVGAYSISPNLNAKNLPKDLKESMEGKVKLSLVVNGEKISTNIKPNTTLAEFLRDELKLTGTKLVCNQGECGSCSVLMNDEAIYSCHLLALDADASEIITVEGLLNNDELHTVQKSFIEHDGLQCGFCTPGQIISAVALLKNNPNPTDEEIKNGMSGNLCRCGAYPKIFDSVKNAIGSKI
ncbi:MAG: (2Fe-2S)-binding protein [Ignavibacteriae bacterium]|nr:(2Fe-2S)-binding protein [Ignavibacteriota bacterium]